MVPAPSLPSPPLFGPPHHLPSPPLLPLPHPFPAPLPSAPPNPLPPTPTTMHRWTAGYGLMTVADVFKDYMTKQASWKFQDKPDVLPTPAGKSKEFT